ncbi:MAG: hypothetical protein Pg6B_08970 [Candidatus Azobacteroides pseudotrichonymphae]|nr:MAG: hypothetical protein Ta2E_12550 [Mycoplasmoidaceae bacterium]GMO37330.1 MAG: hypothetical protein Pg6B_08970 [Candidatus Azobacteroides pseudotrichonymphae]
MKTKVTGEIVNHNRTEIKTRTEIKQELRKAMKKLILIAMFPILFSINGFGAKAAKREVRPAILPAQTEEVKQERNHHSECPFLGKPFSKKQVSYRSVVENEFYEVDLGDDMYAIYKKGVMDKEGISDETPVEIVVVPIVGR